MKTRLLLSALICTCFLDVSFSQSNLQLENWTGIECDGWGSFNQLTLLGAPQTLFQETTDPGEALSSAKIETEYWPGAVSFGAPSDTISGFFTIGGPPTGPMGIAYTQKPTGVSFMYKANVQSGDTSMVFIQLTHWDGSSTTVDAQGILAISGTLGWQNITLPLTYFTTDTPDTLQIICVSSKYWLVGTPAPHIGSQLWVDDFSFNGICNSPTASFVSSSINLDVSFSDSSTTTGNVTYSWDFGDGFGTSPQQNPSYTYAGAGTYNVCLTVVDSCGTDQFCDSITVTSGGGCNLTVTATSTDESLAGMNDGTGTAVASNGTSPYTYLWSDGQTTSIATGLAPGTYAVTVIDADSCVATGTVTIAAGPVNCQIQISITTTDETSPGGNDGSAVAVVTNGTQPYIYLWSTGATTSAISGLAPGVYTCTVVDADICTTGGTGVVQAFQCTLTGTMASTDETSPGANDGTATVTASGGSAPYTYLWDNSATTSSITGLSPGFYGVTVTDVDGCTYSSSAVVNAGGCNLSATATGTNESLAGANDGTATVTASGGSAPYIYLWNTFATTSSISNLAPGDYTATVTGSLGCLATATYTVTAGLITGVFEQPAPVVSVNVYPNPASGLINFEISGSDRAMLYVFDFAGRQVKEIAIIQMLTEINTVDLKNGMYFYQLIGMNSDHLGLGKFVIQK